MCVDCTHIFYFMSIGLIDCMVPSSNHQKNYGGGGAILRGRMG
jgi:hypothetical protein